jgi:hypothetical protein
MEKQTWDQNLKTRLQKERTQEAEFSETFFTSKLAKSALVTTKTCGSNLKISTQPEENAKVTKLLPPCACKNHESVQVGGNAKVSYVCSCLNSIQDQRGPFSKVLLKSMERWANGLGEPAGWQEHRTPPPLIASQSKMPCTPFYLSRHPLS